MPALLSAVVPVFNEAEGLAPLYERLSAALDAATALLTHEVPQGFESDRWEILLVDDGSRDASWQEIAALASGDRRVKGIRFARNFGKEAAMAAGLHAARGQAVVILDADLQHPPELIPQMVALWQQGAQIVTAVRTDRETDPLWRRALTRLFYRLYQAISEVALTPGGGDFRLLDRRVVAALNALPERKRFLKGLANWVGFTHQTIPFRPAARHAGRSAWSLRKLWRYAIDGLVSFTTLPLHIWSSIGALVALLSAGYGGYLILRTLVFGRDVPGYASIMVAILFLSGVQLISLGVLGEYLGRVFEEVKRRPLYLVGEVANLPDPGVAPGFGVAAPPAQPERK
ncbi:glycosyltransferase family 2 protein [Hydrogenophilus thiooxidans]|uniref:glycosyltransferase family 2 protein n=1 Tax=Hydrogenophilus thiooxidans TaxID=2820326 RepID=UPI001C211760|nr:glycosyltransferase family 2 protein [Hydrogenophilus thiooxidans]